MKKILFVTGTRADFGKLKPLIKKVDKSEFFEARVFVTGMHMLKKYGYTYNEVLKENLSNVFLYFNQSAYTSRMMDIVLAETIKGLSLYVNENDIDMIVVHGDRVETLAGAIVGATNGILVAHVEGGERTGTIDDLIRHSVSKLSHVHFVSCEENKKRLIQLGEKDESIHVIGSPDIDIMMGDSLPSIQAVRERYDITFKEYSIVIYHPVTTEFSKIKEHVAELVKFIQSRKDKFVVILPNNDIGSDFILEEYKKLEINSNVKLFPSLRFEYFLTLLKNAKCIIGNSSCGIHEAPIFGVPTINLGTRQKNRYSCDSIFNVSESFIQIQKIFDSLPDHFSPNYKYGKGNSAELFLEVLKSKSLWETNLQKEFVDLLSS